MLKDFGLGWVTLVAIFLLIALMFVFATPTAVAKARDVEHRTIVRILGENRAESAVRFADRYFRAHFVETGLVSNAQAMFIPTEEQKRNATGLENFVPWVFTFAQKRIDGFWGMLYGSYKRLYLMAFMLLFCLPALVPALIGGLIERRVIIETKDSAKAVYFHGAKKVLYALILAPLFILFWPWGIGGFTWFTWFALFPIAVWVASKNVQEL